MALANGDLDPQNCRLIGGRMRLLDFEDAAGVHPMGFSRREQLLDTLPVAADAAGRAGTLPRLAAWFGGTIRVLRDRWPGLPPAQAVYPAYRGWA